MRNPLRTSLIALAWVAALSAHVLQAQAFPGLGKPAREEKGPHVTWTVTALPTEVPQGGTTEIVAAYEVAPGWHLYSPDFTGTGVASKLTVESPALKADGAVKFPTPIEKTLQEELQRILEGKGEIRLPVKVAADAPLGELSVNAKLRFQTCDEKTCDFPTDKEFPLKLKIVPAQPAPAGAPPAAAPPLVAIPLGAAVPVKNTHVRWTIAAPRELAPGARGELSVTFELDKGWHLYSPDHTSAQNLGIATRVSITAPGVQTKEKPTFPKPHELNNENTLGETHRVLEGKGEIRQPFTLPGNAAAGDLSLGVKIEFQTCDAQNCLQETADAKVTVRVAGPPAADKPQAGPPKAEGGGPAAGPRLPGGGTLLGLLLAMIGGGLLALVMPCTYPMIPITISFFTKQADLRGGKVLGLALAYGAGIILVFNVIGWAFAKSIGPFAAHPWVNLVFGLAFVVFGLSMFGLYELRLPSFVNQAASRASGTGGYLGVFLLGTTLVVTSFTCTAPVMGPLIAVAAQGGDLLRVTLAMTAFGATMAAPFVALSLFPAKARSLPRAGEWMHTLKVYLGFIEIAAAFKFYSTADVAWNLGSLPRELFLLFWALLLFIAGTYLLGIIRLKDESNEGISGARLVIAIMTFLLGGYFFSGASGRQLDFVMESLAPAYHAEQLVGGGGDKKNGITWSLVEDDFEAGIALAKKEGKLAFVNFTGITCVNCRGMEQKAFPLLRATLEKSYVELRLHNDKSDSDEVKERSTRIQELKLKLTGSTTNPLYLVIDPEHPDKVVDRFDGADLPPYTEFRALLERNARK